MVAQWGIVLVVLGVLVPSQGFAGQAGDPIAVLTEIKANQGEVRVKLASDADWKAPLPLLSLRSSDQVRVTQNAQAVLLFTDGQGTVIVSTGNSPYTVKAQAAALPGTTADLLGGLSRLLMGKKRILTYVPLTTRSVRQPPLLLSPRDGKLSGPPVFEWGGSDRLRYTVRLLGPQGVVWAQADLPRAPLAYPSSAPPLTPGVLYQWELETQDYPVQRGSFTLLTPGDAATVKATLRALEPAALPAYPKSTVSLMRATHLFEQALFSDARRELLAAIAADPDEPTLHLLLGQVYERTGVMVLAAEEYDEAQFLSPR
jgi:hypothetical protein